jgi:hypothetical protein
MKNNHSHPDVKAPQSVKDLAARYQEVATNFYFRVEHSDFYKFSITPSVLGMSKELKTRSFLGCMSEMHKGEVEFDEINNRIIFYTVFINTVIKVVTRFEYVQFYRFIQADEFRKEVRVTQTDLN